MLYNENRERGIGWAGLEYGGGRKVVVLSRMFRVGIAEKMKFERLGGKGGNI